MTNFGTLFKYNMIKVVNIFRGKGQRKSFISGILTLIIACVGILALYTMQAQSMFKGLAPLGLSKLCLFHGYMIGFTLVLIIGVMRIANNKKSNDDELLMSLPLTKTEIIFSKTVNKYLFDFALCFALIMPFVVLYNVYETVSVVQILCGLLITILLPLVSVGITYICDFIVSRLFNKTKYANLLKTFFSVLIFIVVMILMIFKTVGYGNVNPTTLAEYFSDRPFTSQLLYFTLDQNLASLGYILLLTLGVFAIGIFLYVMNYGKSFMGYKSKSTELKFKTSASGFKSIFKKELNYYATTPIYASNTIIGPIMIIATAILLCTMGIEKLSATIGIAAPANLIVGLMVLVNCFMCAMTSISASSMSLEGKQFWILKSSPIKLNTLFGAKITLNFIMLEPAIIFSASLISIFLKVTIVDFAILLLVPTAFAMLVSIGGLYVNLLFPKLNWDDEAQVVKQSLSTLIALFGGFVLAMIPLGLYFLLKAYLSITLIALITLGCFALLVALTSTLLFTHGKKLFYKLS